MGYKMGLKICRFCQEKDRKGERIGNRIGILIGKCIVMWFCICWTVGGNLEGLIL